jgi:uncharacterized protein YndB with AHSA1/START domain
VTDRPPLVVERRVAAPPAAVYAYLTDSRRWAQWQGEQATIDARSGGLFRMRMADGKTARGQFVELVPNRKVAFTWGWIDHPGVPPGSTTVEIECVPDGDGTLIRLTHRDLPPEEIDLHRIGWHHYVPRLATLATGGDPGPDPGPGAGVHSRPERTAPRRSASRPPN